MEDCSKVVCLMESAAEAKIVFSFTALMMVVVYLLVIAVVYYLLQWLVAKVSPEEPFRKIIDIILAVAVVLAIIGVLFSLVSGQPVFRL